MTEIDPYFRRSKRVVNTNNPNIGTSYPNYETLTMRAVIHEAPLLMRNATFEVYQKLASLPYSEKLRYSKIHAKTDYSLSLHKELKTHFANIAQYTNPEVSALLGRIDVRTFKQTLEHARDYLRRSIDTPETCQLENFSLDQWMPTQWRAIIAEGGIIHPMQGVIGNMSLNICTSSGNEELETQINSLLISEDFVSYDSISDLNIKCKGKSPVYSVATAFGISVHLLVKKGIQRFIEPGFVKGETYIPRGLPDIWAEYLNMENVIALQNKEGIK